MHTTYPYSCNPQELLNGVSHKGGFTELTWQAYLALRARYEKVLVDGELQPLFKARKGMEAYVYCRLPAMHRYVGGWGPVCVGSCVCLLVCLFVHV